MLRFFFWLIVFFVLYRIVFRFVIPWVLRFAINRHHKRNNINNDKRDPDGKINIRYKPENTGGMEKEIGELTEYEEIKD